ncbi:MAG: hypothetical protein ABIJ86_10200 [Spirochaetota bacterium]
MAWKRNGREETVHYRRGQGNGTIHRHATAMFIAKVAVGYLA